MRIPKPGRRTAAARGQAPAKTPGMAGGCYRGGCGSGGGCRSPAGCSFPRRAGGSVFPFPKRLLPALPENSTAAAGGGEGRSAGKHRRAAAALPAVEVALPAALRPGEAGSGLAGDTCQSLEPSGARPANTARGGRAAGPARPLAPAPAMPVPASPFPPHTHTPPPGLQEAEDRGRAAAGREKNGEPLRRRRHLHRGACGPAATPAAPRLAGPGLASQRPAGPTRGPAEVRPRGRAGRPGKRGQVRPARPYGRSCPCVCPPPLTCT